MDKKTIVPASLLTLALLAGLASCGRRRPLPALLISPSPTVHFETATATVQPSPSAPPQAERLITPAPGDAVITKQMLISPDGQWVAEASFEHLDLGASYRVRLVVRKADGSLEWSPVDYTQKGIGYFYPALRYWSADSRYFFYFSMPVGDGCGDFYPPEDEWIRVDVEDGARSPFPLPQGRGHTVSPDGQILIYASAGRPYGLHFREVSSVSETVLPFPAAPVEGMEVQAGGAVWSPDGLSFVMSVTYGDPCNRDTLSFSLIRIDDPAAPVMSSLVDRSGKLLRVLEWRTSDRILVKDWNGVSWWIDARTGQPVAAPSAAAARPPAGALLRPAAWSAVPDSANGLARRE